MEKKVFLRVTREWAGEMESESCLKWRRILYSDIFLRLCLRHLCSEMCCVQRAVWARESSIFRLLTAASIPPTTKKPYIPSAPQHSPAHNTSYFLNCEKRRKREWSEWVNRGGLVWWWWRLFGGRTRVWGWVCCCCCFYCDVRYRFKERREAKKKWNVVQCEEAKWDEGRVERRGRGWIISISFFSAPHSFASIFVVSFYDEEIFLVIGWERNARWFYLIALVSDSGSQCFDLYN